MTITYAIIGITVLISLYALSNQNILRSFMMNPYMISHRKHYYRFITSGFIHNDHMHLIVNMFSFYFFGSAIEEVFHIIFGKLGGVYFIALYLLAIVVSDIPTFFKQKNNPAYNALGASGGVAAVIFAFIVFEPLQKNLYLHCALHARVHPGVIVHPLLLLPG